MRGARLAITLVTGAILAVAIASWLVLSPVKQKSRTIPVSTSAFALCGGSTGSASWLRSSDGHVVVIGAGAETDASRLIDSLDSYGISTIDLVILPHPYSDVTAGFYNLQKRFKIRQVWVGSSAPINRHNTRAMEAIRKVGIPMATVHRGDSMRLGELLIDVLSPPVNRISGRPSAGNNSVVVKLTSKTFSILHLGGIGLSGQNALVSGHSAHLLKSDIVLLPRVSSSDAILPELIRSTEAEYFVIEGQSDDLDMTLLNKSWGKLVDVSASGSVPLYFLDDNGVRLVN